MKRVLHIWGIVFLFLLLAESVSGQGFNTTGRYINHTSNPLGIQLWGQVKNNGRIGGSYTYNQFSYYDYKIKVQTIQAHYTYFFDKVFVGFQMPATISTFDAFQQTNKGLRPTLFVGFDRGNTFRLSLTGYLSRYYGIFSPSNLVTDIGMVGSVYYQTPYVGKPNTKIGVTVQLETDQSRLFAKDKYTTFFSQSFCRFDFIQELSPSVAMGMYLGYYTYYDRGNKVDQNGFITDPTIITIKRIYPQLGLNFHLTLGNRTKAVPIPISQQVGRLMPML